MTGIKISLPGGDLASRHLAVAERQKIESYLNEKQKVEVDLKEVESISESYSDELFGVLVAKLGLAGVLSLLHVINANQTTLKSIAIVMHRRSLEKEHK